MKKVTGLLIFLIIFLAAASVMALPFTETYSANKKKGQKVRKGQSYNFQFDMWYYNTSEVPPTYQPRLTDAKNLSLTLDSWGEGATAVYDSATLVIDFYRNKKNKAKEIDIKFTAYDGTRNNDGSLNGTDFDLGTFHWNRGRRGNAGDHIRYTLQLNDQLLLGLFDETGWGNITIGSGSNSNRGRNFFIQQVSLLVDTVEQGPNIPSTTPVPEPATMLLLGAGLGGMAIMGRRKKKA